MFRRGENPLSNPRGWWDFESEFVQNQIQYDISGQSQWEKKRLLCTVSYLAFLSTAARHKDLLTIIWNRDLNSFSDFIAVCLAGFLLHGHNRYLNIDGDKVTDSIACGHSSGLLSAAFVVLCVFRLCLSYPRKLLWLFWKSTLSLLVASEFFHGSSSYSLVCATEPNVRAGVFVMKYSFCFQDRPSCDI